MGERRDFKDPQYIRWRKKVFARDKYKCRMPNCLGGMKHMNAHHIKMWETHPSLRFVVSNGVTLCRTCHASIHGREEEFESLFMGIIAPECGNEAIRLMAERYAGRETKIQNP
jgi:hypothetical protein